MKVSAKKRQRTKSVRLNLSGFREAFKDRRTYTAIGIVKSPDDGPYFSIEEDGVFIEVELQPSMLELTCAMFAPGGVWRLPNEGDAVGVIIPNGEIAFCPLAIPFIPTSVPDGVSAGVTVIANSSKVLIHDGAGGTEPVAKKSELNELAEAYSNHFHQGGAPTAPTSPPMSTLPPPNPATTPPFLPGVPDSPTGPFDGTAVLEAK